MARPGATILALAAGMLAWAGARVAGVYVSLAALLLAATNCFAVSALFIGAGALAHSLTPRAGAAIAYALVTVAFVWQLFGSLLGAPAWLIDLSPFAHLGLAPARPFRAGPVAVMVGIGLVMAIGAGLRLTRRDVLSGG